MRKALTFRLSESVSPSIIESGVTGGEPCLFEWDLVPSYSPPPVSAPVELYYITPRSQGIQEADHPIFLDAVVVEVFRDAILRMSTWWCRY